MSDPRPSVSIHPYFRVKPGQLAKAREFMSQFIARTATQKGVLQYEFTLNGDLIFCREAYADAQALLEHVADVTPILGQFLQIAELARIEVHGPEVELAKLRGPLADMNAEWFVYEQGLPRR